MDFSIEQAKISVQLESCLKHVLHTLRTNASVRMEENKRIHNLVVQWIIQVLSGEKSAHDISHEMNLAQKDVSNCKIHQIGLFIIRGDS